VTEYTDSRVQLCLGQMHSKVCSESALIVLNKKKIIYKSLIKCKVPNTKCEVSDFIKNDPLLGSGTMKSGRNLT
jgi:hypothetical protein